MSVVEIGWSHGRAAVSPTAAMLLTVAFRVGDRWVEPFARAPWRHDDPETAGQPGHVRTLGAEFLCLPFGAAEVPADAPASWRAVAHPLVPPAHGLVADRDWAVVDQRADAVTLRLDLPATHPIARVERTVRGVPGKAAIELSAVVHARHPHRTTIGLHPVLRWPDEGATLHIDADFAVGMTYPWVPHGGSGLLRPGARFTDLSAVPGRDGVVDLATVPFADRVEEIVQLLGVRPPVRVRYAEEFELAFAWDVRTAPSLMLWYSDRQLTDPPWSGRYRGLGLEAIAGAFDLPPQVAARGNPVSEAGYATDVALHPGRPLTIEYRLAVAGTREPGQASRGERVSP